MTTFANVPPSARMQFHDVYRVTFTAPSHWYLTQGAESDIFGSGLTNLFAADTALIPISANPYQPGDLAATVDFLYPASLPMALSDGIRELSTLAADHHPEFGEVTFDPVVVDRVQQIVGGAGAAPGTDAAGAAAFSPDAATGRDVAQSIAQAATERTPDWVDRLGKELGTAGRILAVVVIGAVGYGLYKRFKA